MIWVTWRQARFELLLGLAVLAAIALLYVQSGLDASSTYHSLGISTCLTTDYPGEGCMSAIDAFQRQFEGVRSITNWLNFLPLFLGMLFAASAVLELESGTYRMSWTQGVSRRRWLLTKIGFGLACCAVVGAGLTVLWTWWRGPFDALEGRFNGDGFAFEGIVPIAYTIYAFALCLTAGTVLRRTVPAIGISFVGFLGARLGIQDKLRVHYMRPVSVTWDPTDPTPANAAARMGNGNWVLNQTVVDASGHVLRPDDSAVQSCLGPVHVESGAVHAPVVGQTSIGADACLHDHNLFYQLTYQPAHRFWLFQGMEAAIFLGLSMLLLGLTIWWVQRRIA